MRCKGGCDPNTLTNGYCPTCKRDGLVICVACREVMASSSYTRSDEKCHLVSSRHRSKVDDGASETYKMWKNPQLFSNVAKLDRWADQNKWACPPLCDRLEGKTATRAVQSAALLMSTKDWESWPGLFNNYDSHPDADKGWQAGAKKIIDVSDDSEFLNQRPCLLVLANIAEGIAYRVVERMKAVPKELRDLDRHIIPEVLAWNGRPMTCML